VIVLVELEHRRDRAVEERTVVRHDERGSRKRSDELLEPGQAVEVEIVGRLVEQEHVETRQQDGRQRRARGFTAGQHLPSAGSALVPEFRAPHHDTDATVEVGSAEREEPVERAGIVVGGTGFTRGKPARVGFERRLGDRDSRSAREERVQRLVGPRSGSCGR